MKNIKLSILFFFSLAACSKTEKNKEEIKVKTPVEITNIKQESFILSKTFKGVTHYLASGDIKSPITGYVTKVYVKIGDNIHKGDILFGIETKEAYVLKGKNFINDPELKNLGHTIIRAPESGIVTSVLAEENEYAQEGTTLGTYSAPDMFVFLIEVPAEQDSSIKIGKPCEITLANGKVIKGKISKTLAMADSSSQTESYVVVPLEKMILPARLQIKITFVDYTKPHAQSLPKESVLSDELQSVFWVMKLINDTTAIRVLVKLGLENESKIEITEPIFSSADRIISKGSYGLSDTAYVVIKPSQNGK
ncbi:MAG TPA: HlyD family efflux transporter periplasmic adaptor subunit [Cytophagaceae bacterium]|jgi:multidrug efflux pump subunit AcrA (membrane-fusion protein)|nr:HlyD family efflux transporter periplasmic adaptor subunit [Cytophagaceae bacterium]